VISDLVEKIARAILYEGYVLYPYRPSAVKNQRRFDFGGVYPPAYSKLQQGSEACLLQAECLVLGNERTTLNVSARFLHLLTRKMGRPVLPTSGASESEDRLADAVEEQNEPACELVDSIEIDGRLYQTWQEASERTVDGRELRIEDIAHSPHRWPFAFAASRQMDPLRNAEGQIAAWAIRTHAEIVGELEIAAEPLSDSLFKIGVHVANQTPLDEAAASDRESALLQALLSTHLILTAKGGEFLSLIDPPEAYREAARRCRNVGAWPVLVGEPGRCDTMLASPIILYDYPQIAPESPGELFDGTEIDEILTLRIMTLTEEEKREMRATDERARAILERTESLPEEQLMKLHGAVRGLRPI
jgi:hypothetical protein